MPALLYTSALARLKEARLVKSIDPETGQVEAHCPAHDDRNASLGVTKGDDGKAVVECLAGCDWKTVHAALRVPSGQTTITRRPGNPSALPRAAESPRESRPKPLQNQDVPERKHRALMTHATQLAYLHERGLDDETLRLHRIGWDGSRYTIPVEVNGAWVNIRRYRADGAPKWIQTKGATAVFYPESVLAAEPNSPVLLCEGEWDALVANQNSGGAFVAITGTGGAKKAPADLSALAGREVFVAYDCDEAGRVGALKVASSLSGVAASVQIMDLTRLGLAPDSKQDVTDLFLQRDDAATAIVEEMGALRRAPDSVRALRVAEAADAIAIQQEARALHAARNWSPPPDRGSLAERLRVPLDAPTAQITGLSFEGANVLMIAREKAGKTVLALNVARSLLGGNSFLGRFAVEPVAPGRSVAWWNAELSERQAEKWLVDLDMPRPDDLYPLDLRGQQMSLTAPPVEEWAVRWLRERRVSVWILDPFAALFHGEENSNSEVSEWLRALDRIKKRAGVETVYLVHHASSAGEAIDERSLRGRGATRMGGWADVQWTYTGTRDEPRVLSAFGRDVDQPAVGGIQFDPSTRLLTWDGSKVSPSVARTYEWATKAYDAVAEAGRPLKAGEIDAKLPGAKPEPKRRARDLAVSEGWLVVGDGPRNSTLYSTGNANPRSVSLGGGPSASQ